MMQQYAHAIYEDATLGAMRKIYDGLDIKAFHMTICGHCVLDRGLLAEGLLDRVEELARKLASLERTLHRLSSKYDR